MYKILTTSTAFFGLRRCYVYSSCKFSSKSSDEGQNHYDVLGIAKNASNDDIKRAYYELSMKYHPDKKQGSQERFREISSAYEILGSPRLRRMYDKGLISGRSGTIYEGDSYTPAEETADAPAPESVPMSNVDQWSKDHYSETFARAQQTKSKLDMERKLKAQKSEDSRGGFPALVAFGGILLVSGFFLEVLKDKTKRK